MRGASRSARHPEQGEKPTIVSPNVTSEPITRPARSRVYRTLAGSALLLWLVGCGEAPTRPQATVVAPPQEAPVEAEREIEPAHRGDAPADLVDTRLFAEPERALARRCTPTTSAWRRYFGTVTTGRALRFLPVISPPMTPPSPSCAHDRCRRDWTSSSRSISCASRSLRGESANSCIWHTGCSRWAATRTAPQAPARTRCGARPRG